MSTGKVCESEACKQYATHSIRILIPARGQLSRLPQHCMSMYLGVEYCKIHANEFQFDPFESGNEEFRRICEITARSQGKEPPDFRRAYRDIIKIDSAEYQTYKNLVGHNQ